MYFLKIKIAFDFFLIDWIFCRSLRMDCPFKMVIKLSSDGMFLEVKTLVEEHNHDRNQVSINHTHAFTLCACAYTFTCTRINMYT